jgi:hypothetical protein
MSCSMPPPPLILPLRSSWRNSASSSAPIWPGGSCSGTAGCRSSLPSRPKCSVCNLLRWLRCAPAIWPRRRVRRRQPRPFDDLRDADDLLAGSFEVLTTTGKYFWIPAERVEALEFHPPKRPRDLLWRRASMSVASGPDGEVYLPAIYAADEPMTDVLRLGRETDWRQAPDGPVRGVGQRLFIIGEDAVPMMDLGNLRFGA